MAEAVIQFKRGNAGIGGTVPALRPGEPAFSLNNFDLFVGFDTSVSGNKFFGSHRYWSREDGTTSLRFKLVDKDGNNSINLKSPNTLAGIVTYTLPGVQGSSNTVLSNDGSGNLSWVNSSASPVFTGIATFTDTTDNTLGNPNTGSVQIDGGLGINKNVTIGAGLSVSGTSTFSTINATNGTFTGSLTGTISTATRSYTVDTVTAGNNNSNYYLTFVNSHNDTVQPESLFTDAGIYYNPWENHLTTQNIALDVGGSLTVGTGVGITQFSSSVSTGTSTSSVPTSSAVIDYVSQNIGAIDLTLSINADTGGPSSVTTAQTLTVAGTANQIRTSVSGQTITVGLTTNVTVSNDLTVQGNLYVNGSTTQVNTSSLTVEDRTIDLGIVNGAAPTSATTWDLGVLFNYFDTAAKKSGVIWEHTATRFQFASTLTSESGSTDVNNPQIVTATFAPIEIGALWVTDCAGTSQVISCTGTERFLENITVDAGTF